MNRDTGEGPGENRGPLLLCFLCLHPPDRPASPTARFIFSRQGEFRAYGRGSLLAAAARCTDSLCASGGPISFSSERNGGKERRQKPMVFGIPFVRLQLRCKKVPQRIASAPILAAADMARREQWSPSRLGDYQIAHLPPAAASVGAAKSDPRPRARNIPFENKSAGRCGRRVRALRPPVRKK